MLQILRLGVGLYSALLICSLAVGKEPNGRTFVWTPTATNGSTFVRETTPQSLRALEPSQMRDIKLERARPIEAIDLSLVANDEATRILEEGESLMGQKRWYDAKKKFEKGLRAFPDSAPLRAKFAEARRRQEIDARYQDGNFVALTRRATLEDARDVFDEVFDDIDRYHVDSPNYRELFDLGVAGLGEALEEDAFYRQYKTSVAYKTIALETYRIMCERLKNERFGTKEDVWRAALWMARQLNRRLNVAEAGVVCEFLASAVCSLDAYSASLTPVQVDDVFSLIDGKFVGIGVELKVDAPNRIARVIPRSPAEEAGILVGDEIRAIDGRTTERLTGAEVGDLLQGVEGERTTLRLCGADGRERTVVAVRRPIEVPSVEDVRILDAPGAIGYLKISCFQKTTTSELSAALEQFRLQGAQALIIDLRQNPGGLLQEAVSVSELFLNDGMIVQTRGRNGYHAFRAQNSQACDLPLVILVDSNSASAAEIFAGAMQENNRAVVVGVQSYGKGTVQAIVQLNVANAGQKPIAGLRLTTEKFYSPKGRAYSGVGVTPNVDIAEALERQSRMAPTSQAYGLPVDSQRSEGVPEAKTDDEREFVGYIRRANRPQPEFDGDLFLAIGVKEALKLEETIPHTDVRAQRAPSPYAPTLGAAL